MASLNCQIFRISSNLRDTKMPIKNYTCYKPSSLTFSLFNNKIFANR